MLSTDLAIDTAVKLWTYCVTDDDGHVKIGKSVQPHSRLLGLQTGNPRRLRIYGAIEGDHETRLHSEYQHLRVEGEWFQATTALLNEFQEGILNGKEIVIRQYSAQSIRVDDRDAQKRLSVYCPTCPNSEAEVKEVYLDSECLTKWRSTSLDNTRGFICIIFRSWQCGHWFELRIDTHDRAWVTAHRIFSTPERKLV